MYYHPFDPCDIAGKIAHLQLHWSSDQVEIFTLQQPVDIYT